MGYSHTGNSNQNKVAPQTMQLGFQDRHLIQITINKGEEETLLLIDKTNTIQRQITINPPIYNPSIEKSRYMSTGLILEINLIGPKT